MYLVCVVVSSSFFPVRSQSGNELFPIYQALAVTIKEVSNSTHFQTGSLKFYKFKTIRQCLYDSDENNEMAQNEFSQSGHNSIQLGPEFFGDGQSVIQSMTAIGCGFLDIGPISCSLTRCCIFSSSVGTNSMSLTFFSVLSNQIVSGTNLSWNRFATAIACSRASILSAALSVRLSNLPTKSFNCFSMALRSFGSASAATSRPML
ncbi:hypothetical protein ALC62_00976 [Cyphomyrmex costatus]|uniref:Uncharacterized protein n=1 Tax=Cyphomyrmex costatus TaxID=456900 RepID=A0A195D5K3_9HYME|nr:hypothetical protein ALC62_00976 [Cyphomyrmex costatus]